jgi:DNA-binding CsgD family transcriptional regulator
MLGVRYTARERQILQLIAGDCSDKQIALRLRISPHTLRSHVDRLFRRHGLHSRAAAVALWICDSYGIDIPESAP